MFKNFNIFKIKNPKVFTPSDFPFFKDCDF